MKLEPRLADLSKALARMMTAWTDAWGTMLTGRALPALDLLNPATWAKDGDAAAEALESWLGTPRWSDLFSFAAPP